MSPLLSPSGFLGKLHTEFPSELAHFGSSCARNLKGEESTDRSLSESTDVPNLDVCPNSPSPNSLHEATQFSQYALSIPFENRSFNFHEKVAIGSHLGLFDMGSFVK
jgi:hypothetical protein